MKRPPSRLHILIVPSPRPGAGASNVTADRWGRLLRQLGHRVTIAADLGTHRVDLLIALNARKNAALVQRARADQPTRPIVLALTGTDLYHDLHHDPATRAALDAADRLVVFQKLAKQELPEELRPRARLIHPAVEAPEGSFGARRNTFEICLLADMRPEKDPFLPARAVLLLPESSQVQIVHLGSALDAETQSTAEEWQRRTPRYLWRGVLPQWKALRLLARCRALVVPSTMEGGANAICEAIAAKVPVLASHIPGNLGLLGEDYPATFPVGDAAALAALFERLEQDEKFMLELRLRIRKLRALVDPHREQEAWRGLLLELGLAS